MTKKQKKIIILLTASLILLDQLLKIIYITKQEVSIEKSSDNTSYILISFIAIIAIVRYILTDNSFIKMDSRVVLSFAIAGATSNVIDRLWLGNVINNIKMPLFTDINLSYIYILITWLGMAFILSKYSINRIKEKKEKENGSKNNNS